MYEIPEQLSSHCKARAHSLKPTSGGVRTNGCGFLFHYLYYQSHTEGLVRTDAFGHVYSISNSLSRYEQDSSHVMTLSQPTLVSSP